jgi:methionyl-tRNA formyltransferase
MPVKPTLVFAGTPDVAADVLQALCDAGYPIAGVFTQPDRPAGRGKTLTPSPVKTLALSKNIPVCAPEKFDQDAQAQLAEWAPDYLIVIAYGLILPKKALSIPKSGALNIHTSLLPRYRGAAPAQRAMLAGDVTTGVTLMQMEPGLDTGPILIQTETLIPADETAEMLINRLGALGTEALLRYLEKPSAFPPIPQTDSLASYAHKLTAEEAALDWTKPAPVLERAIRAYQPWPVAYSQWNDWRVRFLKAVAVPSVSNDALPGTVLAFSPKGLLIQTGAGALCVTQMQLPGKKPMDTAALFNGYAKQFEVGKIFA